MDVRRLQQVVVGALEGVKAQDIAVFNTTALSDLFDRIVIATGSSNRQTRALAAAVRDKVKAAGGIVINTEGEDTGEWVLVDAGDVVVHIMLAAARVHYNLEEIWGAKPMRLKGAGAVVRKPKAAATDGAGTRARPTRLTSRVVTARKRAR